MMDGGERVDAVPMPDELREWMAPFVAEHYKPEPQEEGAAQRSVRRRRTRVASAVRVADRARS